VPDLAPQLTRYFDALATGAEADVARRSSPPRRRRRRLVAPGLAIAAGIVLVVALVVVTSDDTSPDEDVEVTEVTDVTDNTDVTEVTDVTGPAPAAPVEGVWTVLPTTLATASELSPFAVALDRDRVLVLHLEHGGGDVAGEVLDLQAGRAAPIAPSPLVWRAFPLVGWTGREVVVAGGSNGPGIDVAGAAYDPAADAWRTIADPPGFTAGVSENQVVGPGVWTGAELISWRSGLAYDPEADSWRAIAPAPLAPRMDEVEVAVGGRLVVWGGCDTAAQPNCDDAGAAPLADGAVYDPSSDSWDPIPAGPLGGGFGSMAVATGSTDVVVVVPEPVPGSPSTAVLDTGSMTWRELPDLPAGVLGRASSLVWTGTHVLVWGGYDPGSGMVAVTGEGFVLDPGSGRWTPLQTAPRGRRGHTTVWTDHGLVVAGGDPAEPMLFTPTAGALGPPG
jgi:hypothetical protein